MPYQTGKARKSRNARCYTKPSLNEWTYSVSVPHKNGTHEVSIFRWIAKTSDYGLRREKTSFKCIGDARFDYAETAAEMLVNALNKQQVANEKIMEDILKNRKSQRFYDIASLKKLRASLTLTVCQEMGKGYEPKDYDI